MFSEKMTCDICGIHGRCLCLRTLSFLGSLSFILNPINFKRMSVIIQANATMNSRLVSFLNKHVKTVNSIHNFNFHFLNYAEESGKIDKLLVLRESRMDGLKERKAELKQALLFVVKNLRDRLMAYAFDKGDKGMYSMVKFTESQLDKATDPRMKSRITLLLEQARALPEDATAFGITTQLVDSVVANLKEYADFSPETYLGRSSLKLNNEHLNDLIKQSNFTLKKMDALVKMERHNFPEFYEGYLEARKLPPIPIKKLKLRVKTVDLSGQPVKNVHFEILLPKEEGTAILGNKVSSTTSSLQKVLSKKTTRLGAFRINSLPDGEYQAVVRKLGYVDQVVPFLIVAGELTDLQVTLEPK